MLKDDAGKVTGKIHVGLSDITISRYFDGTEVPHTVTSFDSSSGLPIQTEQYDELGNQTCLIMYNDGLPKSITRLKKDGASVDYESVDETFYMVRRTSPLYSTKKELDGGKISRKYQIGRPKGEPEELVATGPEEEIVIKNIFDKNGRKTQSTTYINGKPDTVRIHKYNEEGYQIIHHFNAEDHQLCLEGMNPNNTRRLLVEFPEPANNEGMVLLKKLKNRDDGTEEVVFERTYPSRNAFKEDLPVILAQKAA